MNLNGISARSMYGVDVLWSEGHHSDVVNGDKMYDVLKQMERNLSRDGFTITGSIRQGFECYKNGSTVKIVVEKL